MLGFVVAGLQVHLLRIGLAVGAITTTSLAGAAGRVAYPVSAVPMRADIAATVRALDAADYAKRLDFSIALKMRNFEELEARVARGETFSREELERLYLPRPADYETVKAWALAQGMTVRTEDSSRLSVFLNGSVAQVQSALRVNMVKVTSEGADYPAANSAPSLPGEISRGVLGVNGLHPYHHLHKHLLAAPHAWPSSGYKINNILSTYDATNLGVTGAGETIAILIDSAPADSDLAAFWSANSSAQKTANVTVIGVNGAVAVDGDGEATLDAEWSGGVAPGAKIRVYATGLALTDAQLDAGLARILSDAGADSTIHQLSISLGEGETFETDASEFATDHNYFTALASQGVSTFVSSGDGGSTPDGKTSRGSTGPLQAEYYASDSSVTGVGGTSLQVVSASNFTRSSETAWSGSGGGVSGQFGRPSWQTGAGVPAGAMRCVPDVAMTADLDTGAYFYFQGSGAQPIGGTSWSAPTWAGFCALINEARAKVGKTGGMGLLNPAIYPLIGSANFTDITSGSNAEGSKAGGKYPATAGYDPVTGIGVPDVRALTTALGGVLPPTPVISAINPASGPVGASVVITGTNLSAPTAVSFNGASAIFTADSAAQITATVPSGVSTGPILVTTAGGSAQSSTFTVTTSAHVTISQIYGGGGGSGPTYKSDYIELFNPTASALSLATCSVQYAAANGSSWSLTKLTGTIKAYSYYLVREASGTSGTTLPVAADATGTLAIASTAGKIALVDAQTALGAADGPTSAGVVDFVGFGAATAFEGSGPAPAPSATTADFRAGGGFTDADNNAADFAVAAPSPRNSASPANPPSLPDLAVTAAHAPTNFKQTDIGDIYSFVVTNSGTAATAGTITLTVALPGGETMTAMTGAGWTANPATLSAVRSDALPAKASYPPLNVTVSVAETAGSNLTASASVSGGGETNVANNSVADATTVTALTSSERWRYDNFGSIADSGAAADSAVATGDGMTNLLKYAFGLPALIPAAPPIAVDLSAGHLRLTATRNPDAADVRFSAQVSSDLTNWTTDDAVIDQNAGAIFQAHDAASGSPRYIRLQVTR